MKYIIQSAIILVIFLYEVVAIPTLYLVGDSTMAHGSSSTPLIVGWGVYAPNYFENTELKVVNSAIAGRSARSYTVQGHWADVLALLQKNDIVVLSMGKNDGGDPTKDATGRADLPGTGNNTVTVTFANGSTEIVHTFGWYIRTWATQAQEKGAIPVMVSMTAYNDWNTAQTAIIDNSNSEGPVLWTKQVAVQLSLTYVDLFHFTATKYNQLGYNKTTTLFPSDHTHTDAEGANVVAQAFVSGLKCDTVNILTKYFNAAGNAVAKLC